MRGRRRVLLACLAVVIVCIVALSATRGGGDPATPTVEPVAAGQGAPASGAAAAGCSVTPRPQSFLVTLVEAPDPDVTPTPVAGVPDGVAVDETTRGDVSATVAALIACTNAGDLLRAFALYEDGYLRRILDPEGAMSAEIANELVVSFATPEPVAGDRRTALVGLPVLRQLADGSVAVVTETNGGAEDDDDETELGLLILARGADGRWLIVDGRTGLSRDELPAA